MGRRFTRERDSEREGSGASTATRTRVVEERRDRDRDETRTRAGVGTGTMREIQARQHDEWGGLNWGSAFFGWLVAVGLAALLTGLLAGAGAAIGLTQDASVDAADAGTLSVAGAILLLIVLAIAYYCGGYVAGRMSRFDGARQGAGVWIVGLIIMLALAALAFVAGSEFNVLQRLNLPTLPIDEQSFATGGIIASVAALVVTLLAAIFGGKVGERFHRKVDRTAVVD